MSNRLLENKNAIIYGGGGSIGGAVAKAFGREGARVYLAGRTLENLEAVASAIRRQGGQAHTAQLDALDEKAVDAHAAAVHNEVGGIDISFNLVTHGDVQGTPLVDMTPDDFARPVETAIRTMFLTARAAARSMIKRGSGVILVFGGEGNPLRDYHIGGLQVAFSAMEMLRRQLSMELGRYGIRVVTLRTGGVPESIQGHIEMEVSEPIVEGIVKATMLNRAARLEDVGNVAAFVASDKARCMTAATANISCGALID